MEKKETLAEMLPNLKKQINKILKVESTLKEAINVAVNLLENLKGRQLNDIERQRFIKVLKDQEINPDELYEELCEEKVL